MNKFSCFENPVDEDMVVIRKWHLRFCHGDTCSAALLSYFDHWHRFKIEECKKNRMLNDQFQKNGYNRSEDESLYQYHTYEEIQESLLGIYGRTKIIAAMKILLKRRAISIHRNPTRQNKYSQMNFYLFNFKRVNNWFKSYKKHQGSEVDSGHRSKIDQSTELNDGRSEMNSLHNTLSLHSVVVIEESRIIDEIPEQQQLKNEKPKAKPSANGSTKIIASISPAPIPAPANEVHSVPPNGHSPAAASDSVQNDHADIIDKIYNSKNRITEQGVKFYEEFLQCSEKIYCERYSLPPIRPQGQNEEKAAIFFSDIFGKVSINGVLAAYRLFIMANAKPQYKGAGYIKYNHALWLFISDSDVWLNQAKAEYDRMQNAQILPENYGNEMPESEEITEEEKRLAGELCAEFSKLKRQFGFGKVANNGVLA